MLVMLKLAEALEQMKGKFKFENAGRCKHITHELYTIHASQLRTATSQAIKSSYISPYFNIQYLGIIHIQNILYKRKYLFSATLQANPNNNAVQAEAQRLVVIQYYYSTFHTYDSDRQCARNTLEPAHQIQMRARTKREQKNEQPEQMGILERINEITHRQIQDHKQTNTNKRSSTHKQTNKQRKDHTQIQLQDHAQIKKRSHTDKYQ